MDVVCPGVPKARPPKTGRDVATGVAPNKIEPVVWTVEPPPKEYPVLGTDVPNVGAADAVDGVVPKLKLVVDAPPKERVGATEAVGVPKVSPVGLEVCVPNAKPLAGVEATGAPNDVGVPKVNPVLWTVGATDAIGVPNVILPEGWDVPNEPNVEAVDLK